MRILITGSNGFIGSWLGKCLKAQTGITVFGLDVQPTHIPGTCDYYTKQDILDYKGLELAFDHIRPHVVYHLAAKLGVKDVMDKPGETVSENVLGTLHVTGLCKHYGSHLIFASTSDVYGHSTDLPFKESGHLSIGPSVEPRWSYAISKLAGEHLTLSINGTVIRFFNVTGPGQKVNYVVPLMVKASINGDPIGVYGDGSQTRCFADVQDVVVAVGMLVDHLGEIHGQIYNIGHDEEINMLDLAWLVKSTTNGAGLVTRLAPPTNYTEMPRRVPDLTKIKKLLPQWGCKSVLSKTIKDIARKMRKEKGK